MMRVRRLTTSILNGAFIRSVSILAGGTVLSQVVLVAFLPILTRLYEPGDFGIFAAYSAMVSIIAVSACLRLEVAIPLPESESDAVNLLVLSIFSVFSISVLVSMLLYLMPAFLINQLSIEMLRPYFWLIPIGVFFAGGFSVVQFWGIRKKQFSDISRVRVAQSAVSIGTQLIVGLKSGSTIGLLLGQLFGFALGFIFLLIGFSRQARNYVASITASSLWRTLRRHSQYPKYSALEALANTTAIQGPIVIIGAALLSAEAGFLMLAMRVIQVPMSFLGSAVAQVFLAHAPEENRKNTLPQFTANAISGLIKAGVGPIICVGLVAPDVFGHVFGESWWRAGEIVMWMVPWMVLQFITSPVSMVLHVKERQKLAMVLQCFGLLLRLGMVLFAVWFQKDYVVEYYAVSGAIFYLLYFFIVLRVANCGVQLLINDAVSWFKHILIWVSLGYVSLMIFKLIVS